jgi:uncharacterized protein (DUF433 family)
MKSKTENHAVNDWRTRPVYTITQAAKLAGTTSPTVRRWLYGYKSDTGNMQPVFGIKEKRKEADVEISFLQLAEIIVVSGFRHRSIKLEGIRRAHTFARDRFGIEYPFASLKLKTDGLHVLMDFQKDNPGEKLLSLDRSGQWALPGKVLKVLEEFDFDTDKELALRWFPKGRNIPIVIDPQYGAGRPTFVNTRLAIETLYKRWKTGQPIRAIASDFRLQKDLVESSLQYAESFAA